MRIIFMGTPPFAVPALQALVGAGHRVIAAYTRAPQPANRGKALQKSAVHLAAEALGIPVHTPRTLRDADEQAIFAALAADVAVVAAYGLILPQPVLDAPARGCLNIHASLLPRWRGAAPIQRAILAGDLETGVTIMQMEAGLDTGPMLGRAVTTTARKTAGELTSQLGVLGAELMVSALQTPFKAVIQPIAGVTVAPKITKAEARLDFNRSASDLERAVRAYNPAPGAFFELNGERVKILAADALPGVLPPGVTGPGLSIGTGDGILQPLAIQRAGKPAMAVRDALNGWPVAAGTRLA